MAVQSTLNRLPRQRRGSLATVLAVAATAIFQGVSFVTAPLETGIVAPRVQRTSLFARGGDEVDDDEIEFDSEGMFTTLGSLSPGQELQGVVTRVLDRVAIVDVGVGQEGIVPVSKIADQRVDHPSDVVREGQDVRVWVVEATESSNPRESKLVLSMSKNKAINRKDLNLGDDVSVAVFKDVGEDTWLEGTIVSELAAGLLISVPAPDGSGQATGLCLKKNMLAGSHDLLSKVKVRIADVNERSNRISMTMLEPPISLEPFQDYTEWMTGTVVSTAAFGSFVRVPAPDGSGEADGLVPLSELEDTPMEGDSVKVRLLSLNLRDSRMSLSMKPFPGDAPELKPFKELAKDVWISGVVTRMEDYGAFITVSAPEGGEKAEGLLRVSEIKDGEKVEDPAEELEMDQEVEVRVLAVSPKQGLSLTMKKVPAKA